MQLCFLLKAREADMHALSLIPCLIGKSSSSSWVLLPNHLYSLFPILQCHWWHPAHSVTMTNHAMGFTVIGGNAKVGIVGITRIRTAHKALVRIGHILALLRGDIETIWHRTTKLLRVLFCSQFRIAYVHVAYNLGIDGSESEEEKREEADHGEREIGENRSVLGYMFQHSTQRRNSLGFERTRLRMRETNFTSDWPSSVPGLPNQSIYSLYGGQTLGKKENREIIYFWGRLSIRKLKNMNKNNKR